MYCNAEQIDSNEAIALTDQALKIKDLDKKILLYKEAIRIDPSYERAHSNLAHVLFSIRKYTDAADHFAKALTPPDYSENHYNTAVSMFRTGQKDFLKLALFHLYEYIDLFKASNQDNNFYLQEAILLKDKIEEQLNREYQYFTNKRFSIKEIQDALVKNNFQDNTRGESRFSGGRQPLLINFPYGIDKLSPENKDKLDVICLTLKLTKIDHPIIILGYSRYIEGYNRKERDELAYQRAQRVKSYLVEICDISRELLYTKVADAAKNYQPIGNAGIVVKFIDEKTGNEFIVPK